MKVVVGDLWFRLAQENILSLSFGLVHLRTVGYGAYKVSRLNYNLF